MRTLRKKRAAENLAKEALEAASNCMDVWLESEVNLFLR